MNCSYSLDDGQELGFRRDGDEDRLVVPGGYCDARRLEKGLARLKSEVGRFDYALEEGGASISVCLVTKGVDRDGLWARLFARVHGYPDYGGARGAPFRNAAEPLVSCVIVLTGNDRFVERHLVPSIVANSASHAIEIIIVYNGEGLDLSGFRNLPVVRSDFGWVSRAYNAGVGAAHGEYVALFHDDCIVDSPRWIETSTRMLDDGYAAVTPEIQHKQVGPDGELILAKNVPLIVRRQAFVEVGGYDEFYYAGYEDQDFTYNLLSRGLEVGRLDLPYLHFRGMSTISLMSGKAALFRVLFGYNALGPELIEHLRRRVIRELRTNLEIELSELKDTLYFVRKHRAFLEEHGNTGVLDMGRDADKILAARLQDYLFNPIFQDKQRFIEVYRRLLDRAGTELR